MRAISAVKLASVSLIALGLAMGAPAVAQQAPGQTGPGQTGPSATTAPGTTPGAAAGQQRVDREQIKKKLEQAGVQDRKEFKGHLATAKSPAGLPTLLVFGPENMKPEQSVDLNKDNVRAKLTEAGFTDVNIIEQPQMVHGKLGDKHVLAWAKSADRRAQPAAAQQAQAGAPDLERFKNALQPVGLQDREEFKGKLLHSRAAGGDMMIVLVGAENFAGDRAIELSSDELNRFRQQGFQPVDMQKEVKAVRAKMDDKKVLAFAVNPAVMGGEATGAGTAPVGATPGGATGAGTAPGAAPGTTTGGGAR
jgi:hypothetical protein